MKTIRVGKGRYKTIGDIYPISPNTRVIIGPGTYNEQLLMAEDVIFQLDENAIINYNQSDALSTVISTVMVRNCTITGGTIQRSNSTSASVVNVNNNSELTMDSVTLIPPSKTFQPTMSLRSGILNFTGDIVSFGPCIQTFGGTLFAQGVFTSINDYTIWISGNDTVAKVLGAITCDKNSAIGFYGGRLEFSGRATSYGLFGFEMGGGELGILRNAWIESKYDGGKEEGDAISKYGGVDLELDNCDLSCLNPSAYSISEQGRPATVKLLSDCHANNPVSGLITLVGPGNLILG